VTLAEAEHDLLIARASRRCAGRMGVIAGVGGSSTAVVVQRVQALAGAATDALLVATPAYNRPTQEGLFRHFAAIAKAAAVPVLLYNVPGRTAVDLLPATVARLAELRRIVGLKEAVGEPSRIQELRAVLPSGFTLLSGDDATACEAVLAGARGVISVTANVRPAQVAAVMAAALRGEPELARGLDASLAPLHRELSLEPNPIPVKWALFDMKLIQPGIRLPLTWLSAAAQPRLRTALRAAQPNLAQSRACSA
jgi:4-hydroxy-tetrahydrodipicolinate synthase